MRNFYEGTALAVVRGPAIWGALQVPSAPPGETWPGVVPFGAAAGLLIVSLFMLLGARKPQTSDTVAEPPEISGTMHVIILFLIALAYQQSMRWFGYVLPTAIVAPVVLYIFSVRNPVGLALSAILCPLAYHIIFFKLLGVFPPYGEVFDLLDALQG